MKSQQNPLHARQVTTNLLAAGPAIALLMTFLLSATSHAQIVDSNDASLKSYQSRDGNNITTDKATGLDWLDLDTTANISKKDMQARLGVGELADFRYATLAEVGQLFVNMGWPDPYNSLADPSKLGHSSVNLVGPRATGKCKVRAHIGYTFKSDNEQVCRIEGYVAEDYDGKVTYFGRRPVTQLISYGSILGYDPQTGKLKSEIAKEWFSRQDGDGEASTNYGSFIVRKHGARKSVRFDWAIVGNPNNATDPDGDCGAVGYVYRITKHEVTNDQYRAFLNAVDATGTNPHNVYNSEMGSQSFGGIFFDAGAAAGSKYSSKPNMGNKPVTYVSFLDCMRFVNWLENGQPTDGSGTESGVYTIGNGSDETRAASATFFIPNEDEWCKAAYHQPRDEGGDVDDYWFYPTANNYAPTVATTNATGDITNPGTNVANYKRYNHSEQILTTVGSAGAGSASFYGTFDQGGNVREWNESIKNTYWRGCRGGATNDSQYSLDALNKSEYRPTDETGVMGFRVARKYK